MAVVLKSEHQWQVDLRRLGLAPPLSEMLASDAQGYIKPEHWQEMTALAQACAVALDAAVIGNIYYDLFKVMLTSMFGCAAIAVETEQGILHDRNLDWWSR